MYNCKKILSSALKHTRCLGPNEKNDRNIILLYHSVGERDVNDYLKLRIRPESFEEQMAYLSERKYGVVSLGEIINNLNSNSESKTFDYKLKRTVSITFDDGYLDNLELAVPILKKYAFPATFFIATDYLYGRTERKSYWEKWDYLTSEKLRELSSVGLEIGSHSCSHRALAYLDSPRIKNEVSSSKKILEDILQNRIMLFSYPHGIFSERIKKTLQEEGYLAACTSIVGFNDNKSDLFELRRIEIRADDSLNDFKNKLEGYYNWLGYFQKIKFK